MTVLFGRPLPDTRVGDALDLLDPDARILITGARGSIGSLLTPLLDRFDVTATDIEDLDVCDAEQVRDAVDAVDPTIVFHLAADKHAPNGELSPYRTADIAINGTVNLLDAARDATIVLTSTCKACHPETAYGASKLIAERMVLNAGGSVARFYNVVETCGNVFRLWESLPADEPIPVTPCYRYFMSADEAVALTVWAAVMTAGRYTIEPGRPLPMSAVASHLYPGRKQELVPPRRGDRLNEPLRAPHERLAVLPSAWPAWVRRIESPHDVEDTAGG